MFLKNFFILLLALFSLHARAQLAIEVKQYYNEDFKTFVLSAHLTEQQDIEAGKKGKWKLVSSFTAYGTPGSGLHPVCRAFYNVAGKESHFFSANLQECQALKTMTGWVYETDDLFYVAIPVASVCPQGQPIYRVWNQIANHAYVPDKVAVDLLISKWNGMLEGIVMCVPSYRTPFTWNAGGPPPPPPPGGGGSGTSPGDVGLWLEASGAVHMITPILIDGKVKALGADGKGFELDPSTIAGGCFRGNTFGWEGNTKACAPFTNNQVKLVGLCNKDRGMYTLVDKGGKDYYLDYTDPNLHWEVKGLSAKIVNGFVEYAQVGNFSKPEIAIVNGKLTLSFNRDCENGFSLDGKPTDFSGNNFKFVFMSDSTPVLVEAFESWDDTNKAFQVIFDGIKCSDKGTVQVYLPKTLNADGTVKDWQPDPAGWFAMGVPPNPPDLIWKFGSGVTPIVAAPFFGFQYTATAGCK